MQVNIHSSTERGDIITLLEPHGDVWRGHIFTVPRGFESDGVSTPQFLWATISPALDPRTLRAAVCHDFIYRTRPAGWTRKMADMMFYDFCREDGLNWLRAQKAYCGLRLFGSFAWHESRAAQDESAMLDEINQNNERIDSK